MKSFNILKKIKPGDCVVFKDVNRASRHTHARIICIGIYTTGIEIYLQECGGEANQFTISPKQLVYLKHNMRIKQRHDDRKTKSLEKR